MGTFLRLAGFLKGHRLRTALAIGLGVATVASNVGLLATAAYAISAAALVPYISLLVIPIYLVRFFSVSRSFSRYAERLVSHDVTFRLLTNLRARFYEKLEPLAPALLLRYRSGDLLSRVVKDVEELENVYLRVISPVAVAALISALTFFLLYGFDPTLAFASLAFLAATGVGVPLLVGALTRGLGRRQPELRAELNARAVDGVQGARDLLAFGREGYERQEISRLNGELGRVQRRMVLVTGLQSSLSDLATSLAMIAALVLAVPLVAGGEIRGVYLAFLALVVLGSFEAVVPLGTAFQFLGRSLGAGERLFEISDAEPAVTDPKNPSPPPHDHTLRFDRVSFSYEPGGPQALVDVTFALEPGRRIAVVGPSGSGKSTISHLALRFYDPEQGEVILGGRDVRDYSQRDLRDTIGVVSQDTHVFNDTLRANLLIARPEASDEKLVHALAEARLSELVERLPEGLETPLGEHGLKLSGGERQRLSVARALLKDAPLLILDEPTANLDPVTEREVLDAAYGGLARERAALVITHRLVRMEEMDEILVLEAGRIIERGTHAELLEAGGAYKRMLEVQNGMLVVP